MGRDKRGQPDERLDRLNKILRSTAETEAYLRQCADCHINVDKELRQNAEQQEIAKRIKAKFYPQAQ